MSLSLRTPDPVTVGTGDVTMADPLGGAYNPGDLMVLVVQTAGQFTTLSTPNGFQEITAARISTSGTPGSAGETALQLFWKYAAAANNGCVIADAGDHIIARVEVYDWSGFLSPVAGPFDSISKAAYASGTTAHSPAHVTRSASCEIVCWVSNAVDTTAEQLSGESNASLSASTAQAFAQDSIGVGGGWDTLTGTKVTAGSFAADTWSYTMANATKLAVVQLGFTTTTLPTQGITPSVIASPGATTLAGEAPVLIFVRNDETIHVPIGAFDATATSLGWFGPPPAHSRGWFDISAVTAGTNTYTLTASSGALAIAGATVGLRTTRLLTASSDAITLAGAVVGLRTTRLLTASSGALAIAGAVVGLRATRLLTASSGAIALAGTSAGLRATRLLTGSSGAITLAGTVVGLRATRLLTASSGAITLAGAPAELKTARGLTAQAGALAITGTNATLVYAAANSNTLTALTHAITITGTNVVLQHGAVITAQPGVFTIAGAPANLATAHTLTAQLGVLAIASTAAALTRAARMTTQSDATAITGTAARLLATRHATAQNGAFTLAGAAASLVYTPLNSTFQMSAEPGTIAIRGNDAGLAFRALFHAPDRLTGVIDDSAVPPLRGIFATTPTDDRLTGTVPAERLTGILKS